MKKYNAEIMHKAKEAKSVQEIIALAKANNVEITEEEAEVYFDKLNGNRQLDDDELDDVSGGCDNNNEDAHAITDCCEDFVCTHCGGSDPNCSIIACCLNCKNGVRRNDICIICQK